MTNYYDVDNEVDALVGSITAKVKADLYNSNYFLNELDKKYKEAMSKLYFSAYMDDGKLVVCVGPDDDTDQLQVLDLTDELKEYVFHEKLDSNRGDDLLNFTISLYKDEQ